MRYGLRRLRHLLFAVALTASLPAHAQEDEGRVGYVAAVQGSAVIQRAGAEFAAVAGAVVTDEDRLLTGTGARLLLVLDDGGRIVLGPESAVALAILIGSGVDDGRIVRLLQGIMRIGVDPGEAGSDLNGVTPTAIAAARSTEWTMEYVAESTAVLALEGTVAVSGVAGGETVVLDPGSGTDVPSGGPPSQPVQWGAARADDARQRTEFGLAR